MNRRTFLTASGATTAVLSLGPRPASAQATAPRQYLELQKYTFASPEQKTAFSTFLKTLALPAYNRLGLRPVGVFHEPKDGSPLFVLLPHPTAESALTLNHRLLADSVFTAQGAAILEAPKPAPPYLEVESWLLLAFKGMPTVETPVNNPGRVFQLRIYESPSLQTGQKKIEMFNDAGEIKIFRETGLNPVFFGEALFGAKMPNLTYMLGFESEDALKTAWGRFVKHPDWKRISALPEYADGMILRSITNLPLRPTDYSQI